MPASALRRWWTRDRLARRSSAPRVAPSSTLRRCSRRLVVLAAFVDLFAGFPVIAPFARELDASPFVGGVVVAAYSMANLVGNLGAGFLLDRFGRKPTIVVGLLVSAVAVALHAIAQDANQLIGLRAVHGLA